MCPQDLAHISEDGLRVQTVAEHSCNVAEYAFQKLDCIHLGYTAYLAGRLHDMGKCTDKYQDYLRRAACGEKVMRGSVNHTFCACIYLLKRCHCDRPQGFDTMTCELLVYAMGAHHGQFDCVTLQNTSEFERRLYKDPAEIEYQDAVARFFAQCISEDEVDRLFSLAQEEVSALFQCFKMCIGSKRSHISFLMGLAARMVLSALIDGDRRDTTEFMHNIKLHDCDGSRVLWDSQLNFMEQRLAAFDMTTPINQARSRFSTLCRDFAHVQSGGIYRLTLPTGSGKTLSALRYGLHHAREHNKKRLLFVIPLLSILEQNCEVIRNYIRDKDILIEHHSNVIKSFESEDELDSYELLSERWNSPIIITTLVQFLNTLFSDKNTTVRRMSALVDAVIVIDEIQSLPKKTLNMFTMAMNFLAYGCGATIVLSSATQPCFDEAEKALRYSVPTDIVPYDRSLFEVFRRTCIIDKTSPYGMSLEELDSFSLNVLEEVSSLLIICNTKESARQLYLHLKPQYNGTVFHLSAAMCPAHRTSTLNRIRIALENKENILCVSTQLIEAGVDFSFESVIRIMAGLDNVAQSAGRCNRNLEYEGLRSVYLVNLRQDAERLGMLREIVVAQQCTQKILQQFKRDPELFNYDLLSERGIKQYYQSLFQDKAIQGTFNFPEKLDGMTEQLFDLLSDNSRHLEHPEFKGRYFFNQAFKTAGLHFQVFDENTTEVITPYDPQAEKLITDLLSTRSTYDYRFLMDCVERAKPYTIPVFEYQRKQMEDHGMLSSDSQGRFTILDKACYHPETGITVEYSVEHFIR